MQNMSSDIRLKKLRGSGGYVMAQVSDEQQRKGNLGGPDLFLAPIGRLESDLISKYFCNTCEKEYEGSPKVEYENPNEEVAQNLVLLERGQYLCTTCGSAIAEYREFQKPDQQSDAGLARPLKPELEQPSVSTPTVKPQVEPPSEPTVEQPQTTSFSPPVEPPTSFSSIDGMSVYDSNAKKIGVAKQVGIDSSHQVVLVITKNDGQEMTVEWNKIKKIGEIIMLGEETQSAESSQVLRCPKCNFENKAGSKFCESCGNKL